MNGLRKMKIRSSYKHRKTLSTHLESCLLDVDSPPNALFVTHMHLGAPHGSGVFGDYHELSPVSISLSPLLHLCTKY